MKYIAAFLPVLVVLAVAASVAWKVIAQRRRNRRELLDFTRAIDCVIEYGHGPLALNEREKGDFGLCPDCGSRLDRVGSSNGWYFDCPTCPRVAPALPSGERPNG